MPLPPNWQYRTDGPQSIACGREECRSRRTIPSRLHSMTQAGVVKHTYVCLDCFWGTTIKYDPMTPSRYLAVAVHDYARTEIRRALIDAGVPRDQVLWRAKCRKAGHGEVTAVQAAKLLAKASARSSTD